MPARANNTGGCSDEIGSGRVALFNNHSNERGGVRVSIANHALPETAAGIVAGRRKWFVLTSVSIGTFMVTLDGSIVNIALPKIQQAFGVELSTVEWVVVAYLLIIGTLLLPFGRLGDIIGDKLVYLSGFALFSGASAFCGLAWSVWLLVGFRAVQGLGAAMLLAMGPAIVTRAFGSRERGKALGLNAISVSVGLSTGPTLGGILTQLGSWRWIFYINVPVGILAILWAWRILINERLVEPERFDIPGALLSFGALFSILLSLIEGENLGWTSLPVLGLVAAFVVLSASFVYVELRAPQPMLDLRLFKSRSFSSGNVSLLINMAALFTATFLLPFFLEVGRGVPAITAGLLLTPIPLTTLIVAPISGALSDRIGSRLPSTIGLGVIAVGLFSLTQIHAGTGYWDLIVRLMIVGLGQGLFSSPNSSGILGSVPRSRLGIASGTLGLMRTDGQLLGIAIAGAIVANRTAMYIAELSDKLTPAMAQRDALILAIHDAFYVAAVFCVVGVLISMLRGNGVSEREEVDRADLPGSR